MADSLAHLVEQPACGRPEDARHILADSSLTGEPIRVLKHGDTFALFDQYGDARVRSGLVELHAYFSRPSGRPEQLDEFSAAAITSVENLRAYLDQASRLAPNDDRVWLGRASLALRTGDLVCFPVGPAGGHKVINRGGEISR